MRGYVNGIYGQASPFPPFLPFLLSHTIITITTITQFTICHHTNYIHLIHQGRPDDQSVYCFVAFLVALLVGLPDRAPSSSKDHRASTVRPIAF